MSFAYLFYGSAIGDMDVYLLNGTKNLLWSISGNQGNSWYTRMLYIGKQTSNFTISFNATHYYGNLGDMALDDISFTPSCDPGKAVL